MKNKIYIIVSLHVAIFSSFTGCAGMGALFAPNPTLTNAFNREPYQIDTNALRAPASTGKSSMPSIQPTPQYSNPFEPKPRVRCDKTYSGYLCKEE